MLPFVSDAFVQWLIVVPCFKLLHHPIRFGHKASSFTGVISGSREVMQNSSSHSQYTETPILKLLRHYVLMSSTVCALEVQGRGLMFHEFRTRPGSKSHTPIHSSRQLAPLLPRPLHVVSSVSRETNRGSCRLESWESCFWSLRPLWRIYFFAGVQKQCRIC